MPTDPPTSPAEDHRIEDQPDGYPCARLERGGGLHTMHQPTRTRAGDPPRLAAARAAAERGWPVLPLHPYSKHPAIPDWEHQATTDTDQLRRWWTRAPYNIGIACGPAGLLVLDLDTSHGHTPPPPWAELGVEHGRDVLALLADRAGHPEPCDTYTVGTPSGGEHRYFHAPDQPTLRNTAARLGWRIDTRAAGGFIVAAGSVLRLHGRPRRYRVLHDAPVADLPQWITQMLATPPAVSVPPTTPALSTDRLDSYVRAAVDGEAATVAAAATGNRNHTLFKAAAKLGQLVGAGVLDDTTATQALLHAAQHHIGVDGFTATEAHRTIASGLTTGRRQPRQLTDPGGGPGL